MSVAQLRAVLSKPIKPGDVMTHTFFNALRQVELIDLNTIGILPIKVETSEGNRVIYKVDQPTNDSGQKSA